MRTPSPSRWPRPAVLAAVLAAFLVAGTLLVAGTPAEAAPAPTLTAAAPASGPLAGGTVVTLTGTGFDAGATVDFGGTAAAAVTVVSATSITATTPAHATGEVVVTVTNGDGQSATLSGGFRFLGPPPTLASIAPATGGTVGGTLITLTGTEFVSGATVTVGGRAATSVTAVNSTTATVLTPWGVAGVVDVVYTGADGQTVTLAAAFTYTQSAPPAVTSVSPGSGSHGGGTVVTITGTGFVSGATVRFGTVAATGVTFVSATTLRASAPAGTAATTVPVTVTNPDSQTGTRANAFAYVNAAAPTVTAVAPAAGPLAGGTAVTVTGTNFNDGAVVKFGANNGTLVSVTPTSIVVITPAQTATGKVEVRVTNTDTKTAALTAAFAYQAAPTVTAISPTTGSSAGGTAVTLTGTNFIEGMTVRIGGVLATTVKVTGLTSATAVTPAGT
ncbi:MAG: IPT/TIG domain-containing protein, partial [Acidobacteria bacterium]|nr:IPT/TIG domain-containing protein [Acidobacteriota bacterium]